MPARYFYGNCLESNWYRFKFRHKGNLFPTAEHALMHEKAGLMKDEVTAAKILKAATPRAAKALGRKVEPTLAYDHPTVQDLAAALAG